MLTIRRNPELDTGLVQALLQVWAAVTNAGGAVGFVPPVGPEDVRGLAEEAFAKVQAGADDLVVGFDDGEPVAFGFLATNTFALHRHWGTIKRLQRHPDRAGRGLGAAVLDELESAARDRGLELVTLTVRGGTGREGFYLAHGYRLDARLPGRLKLAEGLLVEELHLSKSLTTPTSGSAAAGRAGPVLRVRRLDPDLPLPRYAHPGDAGLDLHAREDLTLAPGQRSVVATGVAIALPPGHVGLVHPRSGLAARHGVALVNAPGTIDEGYRGEICVVLVNLDPTTPVQLARGDRIAQLVVQRVERVGIVEVDVLPDSGRGQAGFGSSGR